MIKKISLSRALIATGIYLLFEILSLIYAQVIGEIFDYQGFTIVQESMQLEYRVFLALLILVVTFLNLSTFIYLMSMFYIVIVIIPTLLLHNYMESDIRILLSHLLFMLILISLSKINFAVKTSTLSNKKKETTLFYVSLVLILPFLVIYADQINPQNLLLIELDESRDLERSTSNLYTGYVYGLLSNVILPIAILLGIKSKRYRIVVISLALLLFLFLVGAHKSVYISIFFLVIFYFFSMEKKLMLFVWGFAFFNVMAYWFFLKYDNVIPISIFTRRVLFLPAYLDICYFDFFSDRPLTWSSSWLKAVFEYPYQYSPAKLIGLKYFGNEVTNANVGIVSDGFANLNWYGVVFNSIIMSTILVFFDKCNVHRKFFGIYFVFFMTMFSSALSTLLFTHGGLALIIITQFFLKDSAESIEHSKIEST